MKMIPDTEHKLLTPDVSLIGLLIYLSFESHDSDIQDVNYINLWKKYSKTTKRVQM